MKNRKTEQCRARGVSLPRDIEERVDRKLKQLGPRVKGFSHYVQLLIRRDLKMDCGGQSLGFAE